MMAAVGGFAMIGLAALSALAGYGAGVKRTSERAFQLGYQRGVRETQQRLKAKERKW